ncbi:MAG: hypothetical protein JSU07_09435 [Bacteroidetes bacterium]|nr:hypothetical protein [Bacteroidota bacterium]
MKSKEKVHQPIFNIERSISYILISLAFSALLCYLAYSNLLGKEADMVKPLAFFLPLPALFISFNTLWMLINPFAVFYKNKFELKQWLFSNKEFYFIDVKKAYVNSKGYLIITYNDDEFEKIKLIGIRSSHAKLIESEFNKMLANYPKVF